jgi:hypothetical protein
MSLRVLVGLGLVASLAGCPTTSSPTGDAGDHHSAFPDCEAVIEACHDVEDASPEALECHNVAHEAASNDDCAPTRVECVALCEALLTDGGHADDDGGHADEDAAASDVDAGT